MHREFWWGNPKPRDYLEDSGVDGRIKREGVDWLQVEMSREGLCRLGNEPSSYGKTCGIYRLAEDLLVSQAALFHGVVCCRNVGTVCYVILQVISCQRPGTKLMLPF
jgi:hypothetical protein